jgi:hypothetical protein
LRVRPVGLAESRFVGKQEVIQGEDLSLQVCFG